MNPKERGELRQGAPEWFAAHNPSSNLSKNAVIEMMYAGAGAVFADITLTQAILEVEKVNRVEDLGEKLAQKAHGISREAKLDSQQPLFKALSARIFRDRVAVYRKNLDTASPITTKRIIRSEMDPAVTEIITEGTEDIEAKKTRYDGILEAMEEAIIEYEENHFAPEDQDKPELLSYAYRMLPAERLQRMLPIRNNDNWKPLRKKVQEMKRRGQ